MRAQNPKQKTGGPSQAFAHWWKDSRYGDLGKAGGSFAQKQLWKPKVLAARAYELVRRLPNFKGIQKEIAAEDIDTFLDLMAQGRIPLGRAKHLALQLDRSFQ